MWPWEHLAVGYVAYSLWSRVRPGDRDLGTAEVVALSFGTQFPDLVDKPLGWGTNILPTGTSFAHSLFTAVPTTIGVLLLVRRRGHPELGVAFGFGYLLHLPGDVVYSLLVRQQLGNWTFLLWPVLPAAPKPPTSIVGRTGALAERLLEVLAGPYGPTYVVLELLLLGTAIVLWWCDGRPGLGWLPGDEPGADR